MNEIKRIEPGDGEGRSLILRGQQLAVTLGETARGLAFRKNSRRSLYQIAGIKPRPRDRLLSFMLIFGLVFLLIVPIVAGTAYYTFFASDVFESETRFVVRSAIPAIPKKESTSETGSPSAKIAQDTQVVANFVTSPAIIEQIDQEFGFAKLFGNDDIDYISRLEKDATAEEKLEYWEDMVDSFIDPRSGIVTLNFQAFTADQVQTLAEYVIKQSEEKVNQLNTGIWNELVSSAQKDLENAKIKMDELRIQLREEQNKSGIFDVELLAESTTTIIETIRLEILELEARREVRLTELDSQSSVILDLDRQIAVRNEQIKRLQAEIAGTASEKVSIASYYANFETLRVESKIAEEHFERAVRELERVKLLSSLQLVYLDAFLPPSLPDESTQP
ncbi:MAG: hypothetical protein AAFW66_09660, partial [Pseudomonadota bacterium]